MNDFWNSKYDSETFVYGQEPNVFFREQLKGLKAGSILIPADGEGRNSVYALQQGWQVKAFDFSDIAKEKALQLAESLELKIDYDVADVMTFEVDTKFDVLCLCFAHFTADIRAAANKRLLQFLKPNGMVIFEAFSKEQLGRSSGGPKKVDILFSIDEIKEEFKGLDFQLLEATETELNEGPLHQGKAAVIRFVGRKQS